MDKCGRMCACGSVSSVGMGGGEQCVTFVVAVVPLCSVRV